MKKSIAAFLLFSAFQVNSQEVLQTEIPAPPAAAGEETRLKPVAKEWALTFGLTGLINNLQLEGSGSITGHPIIFVKRYIKDDLALRLGFGLNTVRNTTIIKDSLPQLSAFSEFDSVYKRNDISFTGGIEKHLGRHRRIDPYFGGELMLQFLGKQTRSLPKPREKRRLKANIRQTEDWVQAYSASSDSTTLLPITSVWALSTVSAMPTSKPGAISQRV